MDGSISLRTDDRKTLRGACRRRPTVQSVATSAGRPAAGGGSVVARGTKQDREYEHRDRPDWFQIQTDRKPRTRPLLRNPAHLTVSARTQAGDSRYGDAIELKSPDSKPMLT
jgi:hypothetical protein